MLEYILPSHRCRPNQPHPRHGEDGTGEEDGIGRPIWEVFAESGDQRGIFAPAVTQGAREISFGSEETNEDQPGEEEALEPEVHGGVREVPASC